MKTTSRGAAAILSSATALMLATPARAQLTTYEDEAAYVAALAALGASVFQEGFEDGAAWGSARFPTTALSVTSQGVVWTANGPSSRITTSGGAAQTGDWGVFAFPHGITTGGEFDVQRDGFIGTRAGSALFGVGGWVSTSTPGAEVQFAIDGAAVGFADPLLLGPARFFGVIDAAGFTTFEVYEVQGRVGDQKFIFADDFTLGAAGTGPNNLPTANADAVTTAEDTPVSVDVLANDSDPDLDPLTVFSVGAPANGTAVLEADRTVTYAPGPDFHGTDGFLYVIRDPGGLTASATVTVTVTPVNDPPVASPDSAATPESTPVTIAVLANDQDVDGDALTVLSVGRPANGMAVLNADRTITYTPDPGFSGSDGFGYTVSDGALTASATVTVAVSAVNQPPVAAADGFTTAEDTPVVVDVLANDGDPDFDPLTVVSVGTPEHGTAVLEADRTVTYAPGPNFHGTDGFLYVIRDPGGLTASSTVTVTVTPVNDRPVASPDSAATPESTPVTIAVLANDQDVDGDPLQVTAVGTPANGTAVVEADQTVTYTPAPGFAGTDAFVYTVSDGALTASATVTVAVTPGDGAPGTGGCGCSGGGASGLALLPLLALRRRRR